MCLEHFKGVSKSFKHASKKFQGYFKLVLGGVSRKSHMCCKEEGFSTGFWILRKLQGSFKGVLLDLKSVSNVFQGSFKWFSRGF